MSVLLRLAGRNLRRQVRHTIFGFLAIGLGVFTLAFADGFVNDVYHQLSEATIRSQLGHVQLFRKGYRDAGSGLASEFRIDNAGAVKSVLAADPRVQSVMGRTVFSALVSRDAAEQPVEIEGVEPSKEAALGTMLHIVAGRMLRDDDEFGVLLGEGVARRLRAHPGDFVNVLAATTHGEMNLQERSVVGIFRTFSKAFDERVIRIPLRSAWELVDDESVQLLVLHLRSTNDTDGVIASVRSGQYSGEFEARAWYELSDFYASTRELYSLQFGFLQVIALALIVMSVWTTFAATVDERTAEFGTMRALGSTGGGVIQLVGLEGLMLGCCGGAFGIAMAALIAWVISQYGIPMPPPPNAEDGYLAMIRLTPRGLLQAFAVGVAASGGGAVVSAVGVVRLTVVQALARGV